MLSVRVYIEPETDEPLLVFVVGGRGGYRECWSPLEGHTQATLSYLATCERLSPDDPLAKSTMQKYRTLFNQPIIGV